jgi:hypothetical protein
MSCVFLIFKVALRVPPNQLLNFVVWLSWYLIFKWNLLKLNAFPSAGCFWGVLYFFKVHPNCAWSQTLKLVWCVPGLLGRHGFLQFIESWFPVSLRGHQDWARKRGANIISGKVRNDGGLQLGYISRSTFAFTPVHESSLNTGLNRSEVRIFWILEVLEMWSASSENGVIKADIVAMRADQVSTDKLCCSWRGNLLPLKFRRRLRRALGLLQ